MDSTAVAVSFEKNLSYLCVWMSIEFIEEVHEQVDFKGADTEHNMFLCLGTMPAVVSSRLLPLHPQINQFFKLQRERKRDRER